MATSTKFDPRPPDRGASAGRGVSGATNTGEGDDHTGEVTDEHLLELVGQAEEISRDDHGSRLSNAIARGARAYRNEHSSESKYNDKINYRGRSRLFVPKTRMAVRKNKAGAAAALFATADVISISAQYDDDPQQLAASSVLKQIVDYRFGTSGGLKSGVPWFPIAVGARHDADLQGVCISKQFWDFEEVESGETEKILVPSEDIDLESGEPILEEKDVPIMKVVRDRPMIELYPAENVYQDPAAPWYDPVQLGAYYIVRHPMHLGDIKTMMAGEGKNGKGPKWLKVDDDTIRKGFQDDQRSGTRRARSAGVDRQQPNQSPREWDIIWINENFVRVNGKNLHFWSVGRHALLSKPAPVEEVYPAHRGMRPYVQGVSEIEPHTASPMPPVDSWQPLQLEINDVTNLRLDTLKRSIAPFAKVKRGRHVDYDQLKRRGQPEGMIILDNPMEDVIFEKTPGPGGESYTETGHANAAFDELSGSFSTTSVQTNRQLGDTVGGMQLAQNSGNSVSEYDLRVWVETWVEPVLRQMIHLIQFYESDDKILQVAGRKAKAFQRYGVSVDLDNLLDAEVTLKVNVGIGAQDPMQMLAKFEKAMAMLLPLAQSMQEQGIKPDMEVIIEEIFGRAGFKEGHRFFQWGDPPQQGPGADPEMAKLQMQAETEDKKLGFAREKAQIDSSTKVEVAQLQARTKLASELVGQHLDHNARMSEGEASHQARMAEVFRPQEATGGAQKPAKRPNGSGGPGEVPGESSILLMIVQRLEAMQKASQGGGQSEARVMGALSQVVQRLDEAVERLSAPRKLVRDPNTGQLMGSVQAMPSPRQSLAGPDQGA